MSTLERNDIIERWNEHMNKAIDRAKMLSRKNKEWKGVVQGLQQTKQVGQKLIDIHVLTRQQELSILKESLH